MDIKEPIATSACTQTQSVRPIDEPRRSVGSPKIPSRGKAETGSESKAACTVNDVNNESQKGMRGNKRYKTRKPNKRSAYK